MRVAINAASAQAGGAITYLRNVLPPLEQAMRSNGGGSLVLWAPPDAMGDARIDSVEPRDPGAATNATGLAGLARRVSLNQWELPRRLREDSVDALFSSANFGTLRSRVRQILLVRNALYFDPITMTRIRSRALRARYLAQRMLTIRSILAAEVVLFPSRAMLDLVASHVGAPGPDWRVAPYGTRHDMFAPSTSPRPSTAGPAVLLTVSLYCDQKNLGTLLGAVEVLHARSPGRASAAIDGRARLGAARTVAPERAGGARGVRAPGASGNRGGHPAAALRNPAGSLPRGRRLRVPLLHGIVRTPAGRSHGDRAPDRRVRCPRESRKCPGTPRCTSRRSIRGPAPTPSRA